MLDDRAIKMFVGTASAGVTEAVGFVAISTGERIPANVAGFRTGAATCVCPLNMPSSIADDAETGDDILLTMLDALSDSQRQRLMQMIANSPAESAPGTDEIRLAWIFSVLVENVQRFASSMSGMILLSDMHG